MVNRKQGPVGQPRRLGPVLQGQGAVEPVVKGDGGPRGRGLKLRSGHEMSYMPGKRGKSMVRPDLQRSRHCGEHVEGFRSVDTHQEAVPRPGGTGQ